MIRPEDYDNLLYLSLRYLGPVLLPLGYAKPYEIVGESYKRIVFMGPVNAIVVEAEPMEDLVDIALGILVEGKFVGRRKASDGPKVYDYLANWLREAKLPIPAPIDGKLVTDAVERCFQWDAMAIQQHGKWIVNLRLPSEGSLGWP